MSEAQLESSACSNPTAATIRKRQRQEIMEKLEGQIANYPKPELTLADALEIAREAYGLRGYQFAKLLGMPKTRYSEVVNGSRGLTKSAMIKAFRVGIPASVILSDQN
ncbi:MAG: hypothetical protein AAF236_02165 [Verrucomicrobiota bacterium]